MMSSFCHNNGSGFYQILSNVLGRLVSTNNLHYLVFHPTTHSTASRHVYTSYGLVCHPTNYMSGDLVHMSKTLWHITKNKQYLKNNRPINTSTFILKFKMDQNMDIGQIASRTKRFTFGAENIEPLVGFGVSRERAADLVAYFLTGKHEAQVINEILQSPIDKNLNDNGAERLYRAYKTQKGNFYNRFTRGTSRGGRGRVQQNFGSSRKRRADDELSVFKNDRITNLETENASLLLKIQKIEDSLKEEKKKKLIINAEKNILTERLTNVALLVKDEDRLVIAAENFTSIITDEAVELELSKIGLNTRTNIVKKLEGLF